MNAGEQKAVVLIEQRRFDLAEPFIRECLAIAPNSAFLHRLRSHCLVMLNRPKAALDAAKIALGLEPYFAANHLAVSCAFNALKQYADAERAAQTAVSIDPTEPDYWARLAEAQLMLEQFETAGVAANEGLKLDPQHAICLLAMCQTLSRQGLHIRAHETAMRALQHHPGMADAHNVAGWAAVARDDAKLATRHFLHALQLDASHVSAQSGLAQALRQQSRFVQFVVTHVIGGWKLSLGSKVALSFVGTIGAYIVFLGIQASTHRGLVWCWAVGITIVVAASLPLALPWLAERMVLSRMSKPDQLEKAAS